MGHRQDGPGEGLEVVLQDGEGGDIQVVGGLVQQQHVGGRHQDGEEVEPPPLSTGELADGLGLQVRREEEALHHGLGGEGTLLGLHLVADLMDEVVDPLVKVQLPPLLGEVPDAHRGPDVHAALVGLQLPGDEPQQGGLPHAVVAHDADAVVPQHAVGKVPQHPARVVLLAHVPQLDDLSSQAAGGRRQADALVRLRGLLVPQGLIALDAVLALGGPGLAAPQDPLPLRPQDGLALALAGLGHLRPLGLQLQIFGVVGLVVIELPPGELRDVVHHPLQKVAVVGHHDEPAPEAAKPVLQPGDHGGIQVVGGLVQDQHVRRVDEGRRQRQALALPAGEGPHPPLKLRETQLRQHGLGLILVELPELRREAEEDLLQDRGVLPHLRVLGEEAHLHVGVPGDAALVWLDLPGEHPEEGGLSGAVDADDAHPVPGL